MAPMAPTPPAVPLRHFEHRSEALEAQRLDWARLAALGWRRARRRPALSSAETQGQAAILNRSALNVYAAVLAGMSLEEQQHHAKAVRAAIDVAKATLETSGARRPEVLEHDLSDRFQAALARWPALVDPEPDPPALPPVPAPPPPGPSLGGPHDQRAHTRRDRRQSLPLEPAKSPEANAAR